MSRPRKLCEIKQRDLCALITSGCTLAVAARHVGCSVLTVRREARRNPDFDKRLRLSLLTTDLTPIRTLRQAATSDWRAAAWFLERTQPQDYGRRPPDTFGRQEMVQLIDSIGDVVREEVRDARRVARLRRQITFLAHAALRQRFEASRPKNALPLGIAEMDPPAEDDLILPGPPESKTGAELEQNAAKPEPYLIRACDIPFVESRAIPLTTAR